MVGLCRYILLVAASVFLMGDVMSVTDQQFQDLAKLVRDQATVIEKMRTENDEKFRVVTTSAQNKALEIQQIKEENNQLRRLVQRLLRTPQESEQELDFSQNAPDKLQNVTIEERVSLLELQVVDLEENVVDLDEDVDFLFEEQVIQDERLLGLENRALDVESRMLDVENEIEDLESTTLQLDFRVTTLEENSGDGGNSTISELEVRVESLENTSTDHETRLSAAEANIEDLEAVTDDQTIRITAAEENIHSLQATDSIHDARITALEESGGGGSQNVTIAFHATYSGGSISFDTPVEFDNVFANIGNGYDDTTGIFTVPSGGQGLYYFSVFVTVWSGNLGSFNLVVNDVIICTAYGDHDVLNADRAQAACSGLAQLIEGDEVKVVYDTGTDTTPLPSDTSRRLHGFNGFLVASA